MRICSFVPRLITETDNAGEDDARFEDAEDDDDEAQGGDAPAPPPG
jgi:hypothetical protein